MSEKFQTNARAYRKKGKKKKAGGGLLGKTEIYWNGLYETNPHAIQLTTCTRGARISSTSRDPRGRGRKGGRKPGLRAPVRVIAVNKKKSGVVFVLGQISTRGERLARVRNFGGKFGGPC